MSVFIIIKELPVILLMLLQVSECNCFLLSSVGGYDEIFQNFICESFLDLPIQIFSHNSVLCGILHSEVVCDCICF